MIICGICHLSAWTQGISVLDKVTEEPIELVSLVSEEPDAFEVTNELGQVDVTAFAGSMAIELSAFGYKSKALSFDELADNNFIVYLEPRAFNLDEIVVSGTRWRQNADDIPSKITSISPEAIKLNNPQTAADLLSLSGKVFVQKSQQGGGSPMIRGFATNRLLYSVDGVRMNTAIFRGGNIQNVINLDPFATRTTEVLFGPGSVIYGSDAIGGVMSFTTLQPQFSTNDRPAISGNAIARYSSANREATAHFDVNVGWRKWALVSSISSWSFDDLRQGRHGPDEYIKPYFVSRWDSMDHVVIQDDERIQNPSGYSQINLMQKVRHSPSKDWDIQYALHYSQTSSYGRYDRHNRMRNGRPRYGRWDYGPQKWMMNQLSIDHRGISGLYDELNFRVALQDFEESRISRNFNDIRQNEQIEQVSAFSTNIDLVKRPGDNHTLYYGAEYVLNDVHSTGMERDISTDVTGTGPARYPLSTWQSYGVYINDNWKLNSKTNLQAGLRYNRYIIDAEFDNMFYPFPFSEADVNDGALTGSIGIVYRPSHNWVINANLGSAFRAPNVDDIGKVFDSEPGAVTVPNPELQAERAYNIDVGFVRVFGEFMKLDFTAYYTDLNNAMVRRDFTLNGQDSIVYEGELSQVQAIQNAADARVFGVQLGVELNLSSGFRFSSDLNYQDGEEELDDGTSSPSRHAAPFFMVNRLVYRTDGLTLELYNQFQAERSHDDLALEEREKDEIYAHDDQGRTYSPSWYTINFKANYQITERISVQAGLENITDRRYRPYSSGFSGAGRNFIFSVRAGF